MVEGASGGRAVKGGAWDGRRTLYGGLELVAGVLVAGFDDDICGLLCATHDSGAAAGEANGRRGQGLLRLWTGWTTTEGGGAGIWTAARGTGSWLLGRLFWFNRGRGCGRIDGYEAPSALVDDGLLFLLDIEHVPDLLHVVGGDAKADNDGRDGSRGRGLVLVWTDIDVESATTDGDPTFFEWRGHKTGWGWSSVRGRRVVIVFLLYANRGARQVVRRRAKKKTRGGKLLRVVISASAFPGWVHDGGKGIAVCCNRLQRVVAECLSKRG